MEGRDEEMLEDGNRGATFTPAAARKMWMNVSPEMSQHWITVSLAGTLCACRVSSSFTLSHYQWLITTPIDTNVTEQSK
jgi:hypothetical protein